ncbi:hypothetical protein A2434_02875 [Candidatus Woesebacteria bacterium RIFOXYC1_FULL_41_14]|uniref:ABC transporter domain-containing protein n=7 Tax=Candidatus Woeseibacteriota TaxID=1752722 RepID=A0A0G0RSX8_9BACT|nr:MAG: hypothetical protein UT76_C0038G0004 [Candidatus Woesebacteria bacterium GW2011_GWB1_40_12]KKR55613.1 MAG: hypothetical protein UT93_C0021G0004 [Candidatus Woesebacteria bacterium GW2011_GWF1_40_24]KKR89554.1 MAG: hypothetical protein UU39_C0032G0006 [Candidatus Woesebacteria bacterium GW2011_GWD1_41_12]KKS03717.1 MAG: hypothetical protein UU57_C0031G0010 [Candidatus Woesebacteria bacterium GW2011_GWE1_41_24]KKS16945.1 MAG: hypothetical protein UU74_C0030G0012 [Candidatus Woesebacteria 
MPEKILSVTGLSVELDGHKILKNISFELNRDSTMVVLGPNGAGKTILFKALLGLIPFKGSVDWAKDTRIGYVPQKLAVDKDLPLTVNEFLNSKENNKEKISEVMRKVGFLKEAEHIHNDMRVLKTRVGDLSGGELQRVLIAYALLGDPNVLLFDEPTAGIDVAGEETVYGLINKLKADKDLTIIFISHELEIVSKYADSVLCLNKDKICFGPPDTTIDKEVLEKMYGSEAHLYHHHD